MNLWVLFLCRFLVHSKVKTTRIVAASFWAAFGEALILCIPGGRGRLKLILGFAGQEDEELKKLVSNIDRIRIITCQENNPNFAKDVNNLISINKLYKAITNINNGGESTTIYVVKKDDIVTDFLLTAFNKTEQVVINITGKNLDINKVSNLSKNVQIKGMEKL